MHLPGQQNVHFSMSLGTHSWIHLGRPQSHPYIHLFKGLTLTECYCLRHYSSLGDTQGNQTAGYPFLHPPGVKTTEGHAPCMFSSHSEDQMRPQVCEGVEDAESCASTLPDSHAGPGPIPHSIPHVPEA